MRFFDASSLVKRYIRERGSTAVRRLLDEGDVAVSRLSEVEVTSAFARLAREGAISSEQRDRAVAGLSGDLTAWTVIELSAEVAQRTSALLLRHSLRAGDALQLASALVLVDSLGEIDGFVVDDSRLAGAAAAEGLRVQAGR